ncbi:hypothetical protein PO909_026811 [Leuciscus waleckii]
MNVFGDRVRQRDTPRYKIRLSSSSPVLNRTNNNCPLSNARARARDTDIYPIERGRNVIRNSQLFDHRNGHNVREFRNTARGHRPVSSQRPNVFHDEEYRLVEDPDGFPSHSERYAMVAGPNRPPRRYEMVAGQNRPPMNYEMSTGSHKPPVRRKRQRINNSGKRRGTKPPSRTPSFFEQNEHAQREFFEDDVEENRYPPRQQTRHSSYSRQYSRPSEHAKREFFQDNVEEDGYLPRQQTRYSSYSRQNPRPSVRFQRRSSTYSFPPRSNSKQHNNNKRVSFVNRGGEFRDIEISIDRHNATQKRKRDRTPRYFTHRDDRTEERTRSSTQKSDYIPAQPVLKNTMKCFYDIIRLVHHLNNVTTKVTDNQPVTFQRLTRLLTNTIRPAFPGEEVKTKLEGNAKNWAFKTQLILEQHYETLIDEALQNIRTQSNHHEWPKAFEIATGWARKNFYTRITTGSLDQAEALIRAEMPGPSSALGAERTRAPTYAEAVAGVGHPTARTTNISKTPPRVTETPHRETQTSPRTITDSLIRHPTITNTIEIQTSPGLLTRGDWALDEAVPRADSRELLQPTPVVEPQAIEAAVPPRVQGLEILREMEPQPELPLIQLTETLPLDQRPSKKTRKEKHCKDSVPPLGETTQVPAPAGEVRGLSLTDPQRAEEPVVALLAPVSEDDSYPCPFQKEGSTHSSDLLFSEHSDQPLGPSALLSGFLEEAAQQIGASDNRETDSENSSPELPRLAPIFRPTTPKTLGSASRAPRLPPSPLGLPNRHINTRRKLTDWSLKINKKFVIIGDSNLARFPASNCPDLQIESYPGAKIHHAGTLIEKAVFETMPDKMIVAFGLNNRQQRYRMTATTETQKVYAIIKKRIPGTEILFPLINFSRTLPQGKQSLLEHLNTHIKNHLSFIPLLPSALFHVENDGVHWRPTTAKAILDLWMTSLNCHPAQAQ